MSDAANNTARRQRGRPWPKGTSGNPRGPGTGSRNRATLALDALAEGEATEILRAVVERAKGGDTQAAALIFSRAWPQRKGRAVPIALPPVKNAADTVAALGAVVAAVADGTLSAEEAQAVASVLELHRRAVETAEIEARVSALEQGRDQ
jgi:hypothetical protein